MWDSDANCVYSGKMSRDMYLQNVTAILVNIDGKGRKTAGAVAGHLGVRCVNLRLCGPPLSMPNPAHSAFLRQSCAKS